MLAFVMRWEPSMQNMRPKSTDLNEFLVRWDVCRFLDTLGLDPGENLRIKKMEAIGEKRVA